MSGCDVVGPIDPATTMSGSSREGQKILYEEAPHEKDSAFSRIRYGIRYKMQKDNLKQGRTFRCPGKGIVIRGAREEPSIRFR